MRYTYKFKDKLFPILYVFLKNTIISCVLTTFHNFDSTSLSGSDRGFDRSSLPKDGPAVSNSSGTQCSPPLTSGSTRASGDGVGGRVILDATPGSIRWDRPAGTRFPPVVVLWSQVPGWRVAPLELGGDRGDRTRRTGGLGPHIGPVPLRVVHGPSGGAGVGRRGGREFGPHP